MYVFFDTTTSHTDSFLYSRDHVFVVDVPISCCDSAVFTTISLIFFPIFCQISSNLMLSSRQHQESGFTFLALISHHDFGYRNCHSRLQLFGDLCFYFPCSFSEAFSEIIHNFELGNLF